MYGEASQRATRPLWLHEYFVPLARRECLLVPVILSNWTKKKLELNMENEWIEVGCIAIVKYVTDLNVR